MIPNPFLLVAATVCAAGLLIAEHASAAPLTVTWGAQGRGGALATASGAELPPGCLVRLGYFDISLSDVQEIAWDPVALERHFTELARAATGQFDGQEFGVSGSFAHTFPGDSARLPSVLSTRTVCVWALDAGTLAEASQLGVFTSPEWRVSTGLLGSTIWDLSQTGTNGVVVGSISPTQSPTLGGQMLQLTPIGSMQDFQDEDRDGVPALIEEALGMDPNRPDGALMPQAIDLGFASEPFIGYRFRRPAGATMVSSVVHETPDFRYTVEVSDDLRRWRADPEVCRIHGIAPAGDGYETITLRPPLNKSLRPDFFRLKVERRR